MSLKKAHKECWFQSHTEIQHDVCCLFYQKIMEFYKAVSSSWWLSWLHVSQFTVTYMTGENRSLVIDLGQFLVIIPFRFLNNLSLTVNCYLLLGLFTKTQTSTCWMTHYLQWMLMWGAICLTTASVTSCRERLEFWSHTNCSTFIQLITLLSSIM
jgi:hypothetical protein